MLQLLKKAIITDEQFIKVELSQCKTRNTFTTNYF